MEYTIVNEWVPAQEVLDIITNEEWCWALNVRCKYVELRIDVRDGKCSIKDRDGNPITLEDVRYQYGQ